MSTTTSQKVAGKKAAIEKSTKLIGTDWRDEALRLRLRAAIEKAQGDE